MTRYGHRQPELGADSRSRASHRAPVSRVSTKGFDRGEGERIYGSARFLSLTRRTDLASPRKFVPTVKAAGDIVI